MSGAEHGLEESVKREAKLGHMKQGKNQGGKTKVSPRTRWLFYSTLDIGFLPHRKSLY